MQTRTQSTVVAVFRDSDAAQAALNDLKSSGITASDARITNDTASGTTNAGRSGETTTQHEGGITGWFKSIFGQEEHADRPYYEDAASRGNVLLSATVSDENLERVADILERHSPVDVHREAGSDSGATAYGATANSAATTRRENVTDAGAVAGKTSADTNARQAERAIPVVREDLQVGKRTILRGGVRVYSRMVEEPVEEQVRLRDEHVHVERTPVNREATAADLQPGQERSFEVKEFAEEPVVAKTARVVEEVRVGKDTSERTETVRDTVRHTEVKVDNLGGTERAGDRSATSGYAGGAPAGSAGGTTSYDDDYRRDFQQNYANAGGRYEDYQPAYQYGYASAFDPRYKGRKWEDVEPTLRQEYGSKYPNSTWERMKNSIRYGWDRVTGRS